MEKFLRVASSKHRPAPVEPPASALPMTGVIAAPPAPAPEPEPVSEPAPVRSHHKKKGNGAPPEPPAPVAATPPAPPAPPALADDVPTLDALKHAITVAVRAAQQGKGPKDILGLLPAFKKRTGLEFVASADEAHRGALHELTIEADLELV
jgi:hypothetical protein